MNLSIKLLTMVKTDRSAGASSASSSGGGSNIQVVVRLRPMNDTEKRHGTLPVITAKTQQRSVTVIKGKGRKQSKSSYSFDISIYNSFFDMGTLFS